MKNSKIKKNKNNRKQIQTKRDPEHFEPFKHSEHFIHSVFV